MRSIKCFEEMIFRVSEYFPNLHLLQSEIRDVDKYRTADQ